MSVEEFIVTLPSNASVTNFPNNKANSYTVALPKTLNLDGDFEVAVGDLQYPHNWTNFEEEYIAIARLIRRTFTIKASFPYKGNMRKALRHLRKMQSEINSWIISSKT